MVQEGAVQIKPIMSFKDAGLHPVMLENVRLAGYDIPTPIQQYVLPTVHQGYDLVAMAQTGKDSLPRFLYQPLTFRRLRQDCSLLDPNPIQVDG